MERVDDRARDTLRRPVVVVCACVCVMLVVIAFVWYALPVVLHFLVFCIGAFCGIVVAIVITEVTAMVVVAFSKRLHRTHTQLTVYSNILYIQTIRDHPSIHVITQLSNSYNKICNMNPPQKATLTFSKYRYSLEAVCRGSTPKAVRDFFRNSSIVHRPAREGEG